MYAVEMQKDSSETQELLEEEKIGYTIETDKKYWVFEVILRYEEIVKYSYIIKIVNDGVVKERIER